MGSDSKMNGKMYKSYESQNQNAVTFSKKNSDTRTFVNAPRSINKKRRPANSVEHAELTTAAPLYNYSSANRSKPSKNNQGL